MSYICLNLIGVNITSCNLSQVKPSVLRRLFCCSEKKKKKSYFAFHLLILDQFKAISEEMGFSRLGGSQGFMSCRLTVGPLLPATATLHRLI